MIYKVEDISNATIIVAPSYKFEDLLELKSLKKFCKELNTLLQNREYFQFYIFGDLFKKKMCYWMRP